MFGDDTEKPTAVHRSRTIAQLIVRLMKRGHEFDDEDIAEFESVRKTHGESLSGRDQTIERLRSTLTDQPLDAVVHLPRREVGEEHLDRAIQEERRGIGFAILFIDLDNLKVYNDRTKSHAVGDLVLRTLARILAAQLRQYDFAARWGGDEILGILYDLMSIEEAIEFAVRYSKAFREYPWELPYGDLPNPSVSIGVVFCHNAFGEERAKVAANIASIKANLLQRADGMMYHSKAQGKQGGAAAVFSQEVRFEDGVVVEVRPLDSLRMAVVE